MKQSKASKTLLAIVTILTVMMALIVPSPAYAAKEPPPPPPPPSNDVGHKVSGPSHSSAKDVPDDTTLVVTNNGTPVSLAAQLTTDALVAEGANAPVVKFCNGPVCTQYADIENAIKAAKTASDTSNLGFTIYVDTTYSLSGNLLHLLPITVDQAGWGDQIENIAVEGGIDLSKGAFGKTSTTSTTALKQAFNIANINTDSSFAMDSFVFTIAALGLPVDAVSVTDSNNVTLSNLTITNNRSLGGNGIGVYGTRDVNGNSSTNDITLENLTVSRLAGAYGDAIHIEDSGSPALGATDTDTPAGASITLKNITATDTNALLGDGVHVTDSQNISIDNVTATSKIYGAYLKGNSDGLSITNSVFNNSGYAGLYVTGQDGSVDLENVTADNNGKTVADTALLPWKFLFPDLASGAAFMDNSGSLVINGGQFDNNATAGLWVQNQFGAAAPLDAQAELDGNTGFVMVNNVVANGNGVSPCTTCYPLVGDIFDYMGWTGGSFIDSDAGTVVVKDSHFSGNTGNGLQVYATDGNLIAKNVQADANTGEGAILNTYLDLTDGFNYGTGKIIVAGETPEEDNFTSQFNGNNGTGLEMFSGGFAGVFNTEVTSNFNQVNDSLLDIAAGTGSLPGLEALLLNPGGAFIFSNSPDTVVVGNSDFNSNNGEGLAVMTPGNILVHDVNGSNNDGMGAFLDNCLVMTGLQCTGQGNVIVSDSEFDSNSYAGLVALASGAPVALDDTNSAFQGMFLDQVTANGNTNYGALLVSPADVVVSNGTFDGSAVTEAEQGPTTQQATGLAILSGGNVFLESNQDLFGANNQGEDFGVEANGNTGAGAVVLGLGSLGDLGQGSLFDGALANDAVSANCMALVTDSDFVGNGGDGLTALATLGVGVGNSLFAANGGNGLTALSLGDIALINSDFVDNHGVGAFATSLLGNVAVDPSIFSGNVGNGLTAVAVAGDVSIQDSGFFSNGGDGALATAVLGGVSVENSFFASNKGNGLTALSLDNIYIGDSGFFKNGGDGAFATALDGNIGVDSSVFARNIDNGLTALSTGGILVGNSGFFRNGEDGAFTTSLLSSIAVVDSAFAGNQDNGLTALSLGDVILGDSGFFKNGGDGAFVTAALGGVAVDNSLFAGNKDNGLTALTLGDILLGDSGFIGNGGDGAFTTSLFGGTAVLGNAFVGNHENGLTALSLGDIVLAGDFASANGDNGAVLTSGLGDVVVLESVFGTPFGEAASSGSGPADFGNGDNGLVATSLVGNVDLGGVEANQNGDNGIVATSLLGDINAEYVSANQNDVIGALLTSVTGSVDVEDSQFDVNGGVGLVAAGLQDVFLGWSDASGNQYAGATLASLGNVVVTNSQFLGTSQVLPQAFAPQMLGLGVVGGSVVLDSSNYLPFASSTIDPSDFGVNASGNGVMGALILSGRNIQIGDSVFDENGGSVASLGALSLLGDGVVAVGGLDGNGGMTGLWNTEANGNTSLGAVLFNTDLVGAYLGSAFDTNGIGGLLGVSFGDVELDNIDASGNALFGATTLSGGYTSVSNSMFDSNVAGAGLLSVALGPIWAENVDASSNGILGAGLVSLNLNDVIGFPVNDGPCSDNSFSGNICVNEMTANDNGFVGAAILGTDMVEVDNSQFTGNDTLGSLLGIIPGGGLVVIGGESTVLDHVTAYENFGFGAVVGNTGGVYDLLTNLIGSNNTAAGAISQAVAGSATNFDLSGLPTFTDTGDISITHSSFTDNGGFGLLAISNGDITLDHVKVNGNQGFGAQLYAEGNVAVSNSVFNANDGGSGLYVSIFSPDGSTAFTNATHKVTLNNVVADWNETGGARVEANTTADVDVSVTNSFFNHNEGTTSAGLAIDTTGDVFVSHVVGDSNAGDGADIFGNTVDIKHSHFNYNDQYGLVVNSIGLTSITTTNVCYNKVGPDNISSANLFTSSFEETCTGGGVTTEENPLPWQIINVMMDTGKNSGTLSCLFGTTFLYLEKQANAPDFEWARAVLSSCIVPGGSTGTFLGLAEGALPGALPNGITYQGKAFDLSIVGPNGQPVDVLGGPMMVRFTLPDGFTLPSGKKLDILWWDPAGKNWVELNTYSSGKYAWGFATHAGTFALAIK